MTDKEWILENYSFGISELEGESVPWVSVPNRPGREPFTTEEIIAALHSKESGEKGNESSKD